MYSSVVGCFAGSLPNGRLKVVSSTMLSALLALSAASHNPKSTFNNPANTPRSNCVPVHWALLRTLPFGTEGSLLRWEPQPHAAAPCTPYTSLLGASFKPDVAGRACILSGNRVAKVQTTSRGRVAMGLFGKSKKQKEARRSRAPGYHDATPPRLLNP